MQASDLAAISGEELKLNLRLLYGRLGQNAAVATELCSLVEAAASKDVTEPEFRRGIIDALDSLSSPS